MSKKIIIIAGPNGAGKTTFARSFLPQEAQCPRFINADSAVARVAERVRQGGHHVPEDVIRRRFAAGLRNLERVYKPAVDAWARYDSVGESPILLEWGENQ
jgi:predicted ABC-type ATPase